MKIQVRIYYDRVKASHVSVKEIIQSLYIMYLSQFYTGFDLDGKLQ